MKLHSLLLSGEGSGKGASNNKHLLPNLFVNSFTLLLCGEK
jgi:hypothetical protein